MMKNLFRMSFATLLMASLVFASSCYKKDIDDLENRVSALEKVINTPDEAIVQLQKDVKDLQDEVKALKDVKVVKDVTGGKNGDDYVLTITYSNNTSTSLTIEMPKIPGIPAPPTTGVVRAYKDEGAYYEIQIWVDTNKTTATDAYHIIRIGKDFSNPAVYGSTFLTTGIVRGGTTNAELGVPAYALLSVNPSAFELETEGIKFLRNFNFGSLVRSIGLVDAGGEELGIELVSVTRSTEFEDFDELFGSFTAAEGRWVLEFDFTKYFEGTYAYNMSIEFPKSAIGYSGIWLNTDVIPTPTIEMQYTESTNVLLFNAQYISLPATGVLVIEPTEESDTPFIDGVYTMYSDETYEGVVSVDTGVFDKDLGYLVNPRVEMNIIKIARYEADGTTLRPGPTATYLLKAKDYLKAVLSTPSAVTAEDFRELTITVVDDSEIDATLWPAGWILRYEIVVVAGETGNTTTSNTLIINVKRLASTESVDELGAYYIPLPTEPVKKLTATPYEWAAAGDALFDAIERMGFTAEQAAEAEYKGFTVEKREAGEWVASTAPFTAAEANDELDVSVANTVPVGKYRLGYKFNVAGRDVVIYDEAEIVPPTVGLTLKDAATNAMVQAAVGTPPVTAVVALVDAPDAKLDVATLLNMSGNVQLIPTGTLGQPASGYTYDTTETLGGNTLGISAKIKELGITEGGNAVNVELYVKLTTGQVLPVQVALFGDAVTTPVADWTGGDFFVKVMGDEVDMMVAETTAGPYSLPVVINTSEDITELLTTVIFTSGDVISNGTEAAYAQLLEDDRIESVKFIPGAIAPGQDLDGIETLFTIEQEGETVTLKGVNNNLLAWDAGEVKTQELKIEITDVFGVTKTFTVQVQFTNN